MPKKPMPQTPDTENNPASPQDEQNDKNTYGKNPPVKEPVRPGQPSEYEVG